MIKREEWMHFEEVGKGRGDGDEKIRERRVLRKGGECGIWLLACVFLICNAE